MSKVFFIKNNNEESFNNKIITSKDKNWFKNISADDYAFVKKSNHISELWHSIQWINNNTLQFECINTFDNGIALSEQFVALKLFKLDVSLLNRIIKTTQGCVFEIKTTENALDIIRDKNKFNNYLNSEDNYRKIIVLNDKKFINEESDDVQIYLDNNKYHLYSASFIDNDIINKFDGNNYKNGRYVNAAKGKLYNAIENSNNKEKTIISRDNANLVGFYDLFISSNDTNKNKRIGFIDWCEKNGVKKAYKQYENGLRAIENHYSINIDDEFKKNSYKELLEKIKNDKVVIFSKEQGKGNQRNWDVYLSKYIEYKKQYLNSNSYDNEKQQFEGIDIANQEISNNIKEKGFLNSNTIFYGVPGCGKSYFVKNLLKTKNEQNEEIELDKKFYKRILFHPEYTYSDFIGQIMPEFNKDTKEISYTFVPGPFTEILKDALKDNENQYFFIIEEINRGNAPAIFGNIFQLLDRDENGKSEYEIYDKTILEYLNNKSVGKTFESVYIPSNLTIFATMNTCDQNVFTLDTAFKRRWRMSRIKNDFKNINNEFLNDNHKIIFNNGKEIVWKDFAIAINKDILNRCNDGMIAEDKLLGTHFIKRNELENIQIFAEKIFMYLWNDVVKYNKEQLFNAKLNTLDDVIDTFIKGENVFNDGCEQISLLYKLENNQESNETNIEENEIINE